MTGITVTSVTAGDDTPGKTWPGTPDHPDVLTIADAEAIGVIVHMARDTAKIARVDDRFPDGVSFGTARMVGTYNGCHASPGTDVRDMWLRVTTRGGLEVFWPVRDLIPEAQQNTFTRYDW